jgi:hypothetical protein
VCRPLLTRSAVLAVALAVAGCSGHERGSARVLPPARSPSATASPSPTAAPAPSPTPVVEQGDGRLLVVPVATEASGGGAATSYVVEVEGGLGIDGAAFAREVDRVLADPRSWGADGRPALRRVDAGEAQVRVTLASPRTTDRLCAPLDTNGYFSCGNGPRAVLNAARWLQGAPSYAGALGAYREYLVNHEVGHVLGHGHEPCPGEGRAAPVMLQQTKGLAGCVRNPWPYP